MKTMELMLPEIWASPLINSDTSGLSDADIGTLDEFIEDMLGLYNRCWCLSVSDDEPEFMTHHDAHIHGVPACNVLSYTFDIGD